MTSRAFTIWTDVNLEADARSLLDAAGVLVRGSPGGPPGSLDEADAVIAGSTFPGTAATFARAPRLCVVARVGIGYDSIDVDAATAARICVVNTPDAPTESTAEFAVALMLAIARRLPHGPAEFTAGRWNSSRDLVGFDLAGRTLGLVGCGRIGTRVAEIARALRMEVQAFDPMVTSLPAPVRRAPTLDALLRTSDVLSLHVPLSTATRHLIGAAELAVMRRGAVLINTGRGPLVDADALLAALDEDRLAGAGLDVWAVEPAPRDHPLALHPRVIATPHMAAMTREGRRRSHTAAAAQALQVLRGERPPSLVNPTVWDGRRVPQ